MIKIQHSETKLKNKILNIVFKHSTPFVKPVTKVYRILNQYNILKSLNITVSP